jgi:threonine dehydratase
MKVSLEDIQKARESINDVIFSTKLIQSKKISTLSGNQVFLKCENLQKTGSFKIRGAYNKITNLTEEQKSKGVIASSAGNHAQGVALGATAYGIDSTIVMPVGAPVAKVIATQDFGAKVVLHGNVYDEAYEKALEIQRESGATFLHPFNDPYVIAGQGTIALEIFDELKDVDAIVVPIGGGGLISGIAIAAKALNPKVKIIGVEPENASSMKNSIKEGEIQTLSTANTIADGIAVKTPGDLTYSIIKDNVDEIVVVSEDELANALLILMENEKLVAEGAGAASVAAVMSNKIDMENKNIVALISGGNIDMNMVINIIDNCLLKNGRMAEIVVSIPDKPGNLQSLLELVAKTKANIYSIFQTRLKPYVSIGFQEVSIVLETKNHKHIKEIQDILRKNGYIILED